MLDFGLGYPGHKDPSEINTKGFLFWWSLFLAKKALSKEELKDLSDRYPEPCDTSLYKEIYIKQYKTEIFTTGREFFTWQFAIGMCIYCTNFWISIIIAIAVIDLNKLIILPNYCVIFIIPSFAHFILRKI